MRRLLRQNVLASIVTLALGLAVIWEGSRYPIGTLTQMGPGWFPVALGVLILVMGGVLAIDTWLSAADEPKVEIHWRPLLSIGGGLLVFAVTLERLGLVPATFLLVGAAALSQGAFRPLQTIVLAFVLAAGAALLFIFGLGMPLDLVAGL